MSGQGATRPLRGTGAAPLSGSGAAPQMNQDKAPTFFPLSELLE